jgi:hypothetical protein
MNPVVLALVLAAGGGDTTSLREAPVIGEPTVIANAPAYGATRGPPRLPRLSLEVRAGGAIGEVRAARSTARPPGAAWGASAAIRVTPHVEATFGFGSSSFGCTDGFCEGRNVRFKGAGAEGGVRVSARRAWIAGGIARHALQARWSTLHAGTGAERAERRSAGTPAAARHSSCARGCCLRPVFDIMPTTPASAPIQPTGWAISLPMSACG